jgi:hypothetical protein
LVHNETFSLKKCYGGEQKIVLCENDKIVNNTKDVTECFNNLFSTIANSIGKDVNYDPLQHLSIVEIKRDRFINYVKFGIIASVQFFTTLAGIPSTPVAFLILILFTIVSTFCSVTF